MKFIVGYSYIAERHRRIFDYFQNKNDLTLILPEMWRMKGGKVVMTSKSIKSDINIISSKARFFHSRYPIIRGHLKGWMPNLKNILKKHSQPDDVLYSVSEPNLLVTYLNARLAKRLGLRHVFFTWQNVPYKKRLSGLKLKITEWIIRKNIALSDGVVCGNSKALEIIKEYSPDEYKCLVAPTSGMDTEKFKPGASSDFRSRYGLENKTIVLFVGAIDLRKGIFKVVEAFSKAKLQDESLHLFMIGSGPLDEELKKYVSKYRMEQDVTILPWIDNEQLPEYFANSDIFVYLSQRYGGWEEQFGYSVAEASSSGLPVISSTTGSIGDLVNDKTGVLINPDDVSGLTTSLIRLSKDKDLRMAMGSAGREFIKENFEHRVIAPKLENFLSNI